MKKTKFFFLTLLAGLLMSVSAVAGTATETLQVSTNESQPEHLFRVIGTVNGYYWGNITQPVSANDAALFAFYSTGTADQYYILNVTKNQWLDYAPSNIGNKKNFVTWSNTKNHFWKIVKSTSKSSSGSIACYTIQPYSDGSTVASKYVNWYGGASSYGAGNTIGLWQDNSTADDGSAWSLIEKVEDVTFTVACETEGGGVVYNSTNYTNGQEFTAPKDLKSTDLTAIAISGNFSKIEVNNSDKTINVTYCEGAEIRPTFVGSSCTKTGDERAEMLVDASGTSTKWGMDWTNGTTTAWITVQANNTILKAYDLYNANDTQGQSGRRWKNWKIEGSSDNSNWTEIEAAADHDMITTNYAKTSYYVLDNTAKYNYYRITINSNYGAGMIQMSDLKFFVQYPADVRHITYKYTYGGNVVATDNFDVTDKSSRPETISQGVLSSLPYGTWTGDYSNVPATITADGEYNVPITATGLPFEFSTDFASAKWYTWKMANRVGGTASYKGYVWNNGTKYRQTDLEAQPTDAKYLYAFVGSPFGFTIMTADGNYVYSTCQNNADLVTASEGAEFVALASTLSSGWTGYDKYFYFKGAKANGGVNEMDKSDGYQKVGYWTGGGVNDVGSLVAIEAVSVQAYKVVFAEGTPAAGKVTFSGNEVTPSSIVKAFSSATAITAADLTVGEVEGYKSGVTLADKVFTVTYTLQKSPAWANLNKKVTEANTLYASASALVGPNPGYYVQANVTALKNSIDAAQKELDAEEPNDDKMVTLLSELTTAMSNCSRNPVVAGYYRLKGKAAGLYAYKTSGNKLGAGIPTNTELGVAQNAFVFEVASTDGGWYIKSCDNLYVQQSTGWYPWTGLQVDVNQTAKIYEIDGLSESGDYNGTYLLHCGTGNNNYLHIGNSSATQVVGWDTGNNSRWILEPVTTQTVNVTAAGWATACFGFNADGSHSASLFRATQGETVVTDQVATYYITYDSEAGKLAKEVVENIAITNSSFHNGVAVKGVEGESVTATFFEAPVEGKDVTGNCLMGDVKETEFDTDILTWYILANGDKGVGFYWQVADGASATCAAYKAVLALPAGSKIKGFSLDDDPTGINDVDVDADSAIFNLAGQKINKLQKGVNIVNGRKVLY